MIVRCENNQRKHPFEWMADISRQTAEAVCQTLALNFQWKGKRVEAGVAIQYVSTKRMRELNRETRETDRVTDVLSYPLLDMKTGRLMHPVQDADLERPAEGPPILWLGDLVVCPDKAADQALNYGHTLTREIAFLTAHGMLHLFGFDHMDPKEEQTMFALQESILDRLGYRRDYQTEEMTGVKK